MAEINYYPVFVPDQVLSAEHLNEIVDYLEVQDRLTRNKLIGIGIVCGLELKVSASQIEITRGCGVTSAGYLITLDALTLTHYIPYTLPGDFSGKYREVYQDWDMWELLTTPQAVELEDGEVIADHASFMKSKIVVLLLEMSEIPLKNCIDTDCDDKGEKIQFVVKPVLVSKTDIDKFLKSVEETAPPEPKPSVEPVLSSISLRRFNVPVSQLLNTNAVLNAFLQITDEATLKRLAEILNYCYITYKPILTEETTNPFSTVFEFLKQKLETVKTSNPFFIQYYYDWLDDIIKAYYEFKGKVFDVQTLCCPDEGLFPLHLMLGQATKSTTFDTKTKYRHYFIYSPLFNQQKELLAEVQLLFRRIRLLIQNFVVPDVKTFSSAAVRITPSRYLDRPLSDRCIPYFYDPLPVIQSWNWDKTRKGNARYNLSYNAHQYNTLDAIVNPLKYDIERYNFFRVEGHVGKNYAQAVTTVINQRDQFNLPFEVVALSTATISRFVTSQDDHDCHFKDLDSLYEVLIAELICKYGELACIAAKIPYNPKLANVASGPAKTAEPAGARISAPPPAMAADSGAVKEILESVRVSAQDLHLHASIISQFRIAAYKKGDFIRNHCGPFAKGTVGEYYLNAIAKGYAFSKPSEKLNFTDINVIYAHLLYYIECVENMMLSILPVSLANFNTTLFKSRFATLMDEFNTVQTELLELIILRNNQNGNTNPNLALIQEFALDIYISRIQILLTTCLDERLEALKKEYEKRKAELQLLVNFMNYFKKHPGMEHKAGVPKGGTFILVYHETPRRKSPSFRLAEELILTHIPGSNIVKDQPVSATRNIKINELTKTAYARDPQLVKQFEFVLNRYLDLCKDIDDDTKDELLDTLVNIPTDSPVKFQIPEYSVIADFYLPYLCCSDCPPIVYVVPKETEEALSIKIRPTEFCNNDQNTYPVTVTPAGGELTATKGGVEAGTFDFKPNGLKAGINTLTYTAKDGRKTSIDVKIFKAFDLDIRHSVSEDGVTVQFSSSAPAEGKVSWDFGDGNTSTASAPTHTYQLTSETQTFTIKLTAMDGPCQASDEEVLTLKKPVQAAFDMEPRLFCANDKGPYSFKTEPPVANIKEIKNDDKLIVTRNTAGVVSFSPAAQKLTAAKDFHLEYRGIGLDVRIVVPDAMFIMRLTTVTDAAGVRDFRLSARAKDDHALNYQWAVLVDQQTRVQFSANKFDVLYGKDLKIEPGSTASVRLIIHHDVPGVKCGAEKIFAVTPDVFKKFIDASEFDSNTIV
jgi:hypothetical protein